MPTTLLFPQDAITDRLEAALSAFFNQAGHSLRLANMYIHYIQYLLPCTRLCFSCFSMYLATLLTHFVVSLTQLRNVVKIEV